MGNEGGTDEKIKKPAMHAYTSVPRALVAWAGDVVPAKPPGWSDGYRRRIETLGGETTTLPLVFRFPNPEP